MVKANYLGEQTWYKPWSSRLGILRQSSQLSKEKIHAKKSQHKETDVNMTNRETKEQMGRWLKKWHEEIENKEVKQNKETDVNMTNRHTKEQMGKWHKKWHEEIENKELD